MKVIYPYGCSQESYLDLEDPAFDFRTSEALVKTKFKMLDHWFEEVERLKKENKGLRLQLEKLKDGTS